MKLLQRSPVFAAHSVGEQADGSCRAINPGRLRVVKSCLFLYKLQWELPRKTRFGKQKLVLVLLIWAT